MRCEPVAISPLRAEAIGIDLRGFQWAAFVLVGALAGLAGAVYAFSKGSISPSSISIAQSTDGLIMVLLGGVETLTGPWSARRSSPGCATSWPATPNSGAP